MIVSNFNIKKIFPSGINSIAKEDLIAIEAPLEVFIYSCQKKKYEKISVFMRTPYNDFNLVVGFLFTEQIIKTYSDIEKIFYCKKVENDMYGNTIKVILKKNIDVDLILKDKRKFLSNSSCGICGSLLIKNLYLKNDRQDSHNENVITLNKKFIFSLTKISQKHQTSFKHTGGLHSSTLFSTEKKIIHIEEDIGRHNALDKLIGNLLVINKLKTLNKSILLLSGRVSYELVQKSIVAKIPIICALGAPTTLAIDLCRKFDIMLIAFIKDEKFNVYSQSKRVKLLDSDN